MEVSKVKIEDIFHNLLRIIEGGIQGKGRRTLKKEIT